MWYRWTCFSLGVEAIQILTIIGIAYEIYEHLDTFMGLHPLRVRTANCKKKCDVDMYINKLIEVLLC